MKAASLREIKSELNELEPEALHEMCMRLAKFKKENKELLTYLLFEADNESAYSEGVIEDVVEQFKELPRGNTYFIKKTLRKILRFANRQIKYSGVKETEIAIRMQFCKQMKEARIPMHTGTVLYNMYQQQIKKITALISKLPEDLQSDYEQDFKSLKGSSL